MDKLKILVVVIAFCNLVGCAKKAYFHAEMDKTVSPVPSKSDPIALDLSENATITERNLFSCVKEELLESEFNYQEAHPKFRLMLNSEKKTIEVGSKPDFWVPGKRNNIFQNESWIIFSLYRADDIKKQIIWSGEAGGTNRLFAVLRHSIIKTLLGYIGKDVDGSIKLDKKYKANKDLRDPQNDDKASGVVD